MFISVVISNSTYLAVVIPYIRLFATLYAITTSFSVRNLVQLHLLWIKQVEIKL